MDVVNIINSKRLTPNIINPRSKFVIITYYWGRNNTNKNTQRPCPDEIKDDSEITKKGIKFGTMIKKWKRACKRVGCNYLVQEYPEFAVKGGYQYAINAKPLFIKKALESCGGRSVVYIDGDMTVNRYPHLFDISNIDFMARGWNIDPRGNVKYLSTRPCFDPYIFETSGGIMYFGYTNKAFDLLNTWHDLSSKEMNKGKADDRIISMIFNMKKTLYNINIMQLPIEYLWLTDIYSSYISKDHYDTSEIIFEHPACLTGEEKAQEQGAAKNRQPKFYSEIIENQIDCYTQAGTFFEYIIFENIKQFRPWKNYIKYLNSIEITDYRNGEEEPPYYFVDYKDKYGKYNKIADYNIEKYKPYLTFIKKNIKLLDSNIIKIYDGDETKIIDNETIQTNDVLSVILALFKNKKNIIYIPHKLTSSKYNIQKYEKIYEMDNEVELITEVIDYDNDRKLDFKEKVPLFLSYGSRIIKHLLYITDMENENNFIKNFNKSILLCVLFSHLIRCNFIYSYSSSSNLHKKSRKFSPNLKTVISPIKSISPPKKLSSLSSSSIEEDDEDERRDVLQILKLLSKKVNFKELPVKERNDIIKSLINFKSLTNEKRTEILLKIKSVTRK